MSEKKQPKRYKTRFIQVNFRALVARTGKDAGTEASPEEIEAAGKGQSAGLIERPANDYAALKLTGEIFESLNEMLHCIAANDVKVVELLANVSKVFLNPNAKFILTTGVIAPLPQEPEDLEKLQHLERTLDAAMKAPEIVDNPSKKRLLEEVQSAMKSCTTLRLYTLGYVYHVVGHNVSIDEKDSTTLLQQLLERGMVHPDEVTEIVDQLRALGKARLTVRDITHTLQYRMLVTQDGRIASMRLMMAGGVYQKPVTEAKPEAIDYLILGLMNEVYNCLCERHDLAKSKDLPLMELLRDLNRIFLGVEKKLSTLDRSDIDRLLGAIELLMQIPEIANDPDKVRILRKVMAILKQHKALPQDELSNVNHSLGGKVTFTNEHLPSVLKGLKDQRVIHPEEVPLLTNQIREKRLEEISIMELVQTIGPELVLANDGRVATKRALVTAQPPAAVEVRKPAADYATVKLLGELYQALNEIPDIIKTYEDRQLVSVLQQLSSVFLKPETRTSLESDKSRVIGHLLKALTKGQSLFLSELADVFNALGATVTVSGKNLQRFLQKLYERGVIHQHQVTTLINQLTGKAEVTMQDICHCILPLLMVSSEERVTMAAAPAAVPKVKVAFAKVPQVSVDYRQTKMTGELYSALQEIPEAVQRQHHPLVQIMDSVNLVFMTTGLRLPLVLGQVTDLFQGPEDRQNIQKLEKALKAAGDSPEISKDAEQMGIIGRMSEAIQKEKTLLLNLLEEAFLVLGREIRITQKFIPLMLEKLFYRGLIHRDDVAVLLAMLKIPPSGMRVGDNSMPLPTPEQPVVDYGTLKLMGELCETMYRFRPALRENDKQWVELFRGVNQLLLQSRYRDALEFDVVEHLTVRAAKGIQDLCSLLKAVQQNPAPLERLSTLPRIPSHVIPCFGCRYQLSTNEH
ncbi:unnamed protein product [Soboliphyme baturini]|uniref:Kinesin-associated protein n=1 Tax=Soboliphyme baturini TaxID=241478 RepID=A0A183IRQ7_9BILA|nr:unnamed protein product [Soboliphyme baturini]